MSAGPVSVSRRSSGTEVAPASPATPVPQSSEPVRRRPLLTPRRSNILLLLAAAILLPIVTAQAMPLAFTPTDSLVLAEAVAFAIAALALNMLTGYAGQISLGHAALLGVGAFASGLVTSKAGLPMWIGLPAAAVATGLIALVIGFPALRLRGLYLAMVTIAFGFAMYDSILRLDVFTGGSAGVELPRRIWHDTQFSDQSVMLAVALVALLAVWLLDANITRTRLGRAFRAIRENEAVAQAYGVDVARYKLVAFVLSGALAGLAGALWGHAVGFVNSESFPFDISLALIIMVVVGGLGSRVGAVIAGLAFSLFPVVLHGIAWLAGLDIMVGALLLMYTVSRHPGGFAEVIGEARERRRERRSARVQTPDDDAITIPALPRVTSLRTSTAVDPLAPVLEVENVTVRFGGLVAVDSASLRVPRGKIVGLIGPNGAGKTTLFNTISGLIRPTTGTVRLLGQDVSGLPAHRRAELGLGRTFQQIGLAKDQTMLDNLLLAQHLEAGYSTGRALAYTRGVAAAEEVMEARAREAITALGFDGREQTPVKRFSHGQQRIIEMGCALLTDPELLMLDEPSAGMAPGAVENLAVRLNDLRDSLGRTMLLIEHNVPLVLDVCDYIYVLNFGQVLAEGTPDEILAHPDVIGAYLGEAAG
ncbi:MAG TPA: branched-chain amino acid ABC transporter ATP-binding protein/permease [Candidatus Solibacter sp.]|nr:branched-chain amino acid ABC transporter ATP-binding protein/permease [Candidatus Solibacter sp.]